MTGCNLHEHHIAMALMFDASQVTEVTNSKGHYAGYCVCMYIIKVLEDNIYQMHSKLVSASVICEICSLMHNALCCYYLHVKPMAVFCVLSEQVPHKTQCTCNDLDLQFRNYMNGTHITYYACTMLQTNKSNKLPQCVGHCTTTSKWVLETWQTMT